MTHPWFAAPRPRVLAHRGWVPPDAEGIVENSVAAIAAAHGAGVAYVESDCHLTADGVVVLFHDDDLSRVTGDPRPVAEVTERELTEIMATRGGLATLAESLDAFPTVRFNLDVKASGAAEPAGRLVAPHADRVLLTSFSDRRRETAMAAAREAGGTPATSAGSGRILRILGASLCGWAWLLRAATAGIDAVQVPERQGPLRIVSRRFVRHMHRVGVEVHVWTINEPGDMRRLLDLGVDGIVTDHADLALKVVTEWERESGHPL